jgi:hypothetical protein
MVNQGRHVLRVSSIHMQCRLTARCAKQVDSREHLERQSAMSVQWDGTAMKEHLSVWFVEQDSLAQWDRIDATLVRQESTHQLQVCHSV